MHRFMMLAGVVLGLASCATVQKVIAEVNKVECGLNAELNAFVCSVNGIACGKDFAGCWLCDVGGSVDGVPVQNVTKVCPSQP